MCGVLCPNGLFKLRQIFNITNINFFMVHFHFLNAEASFPQYYSVKSDVFPVPTVPGSLQGISGHCDVNILLEY